jgi:hypothetical protein
MKQRMNFAHISRTTMLLSLIFFAGFIPARAQNQMTVFPRACVETDYATFTTRLAQSAAVGAYFVYTNAKPVSSARIIINPGAANEEIIPSSSTVASSLQVYYLLNADGSRYVLTKAHSADEPVQLVSDSIVRFGYHNTTDSTRTIGFNSQRNVILVGDGLGGDGGGIIIDVGQGLPTQFLPGIHENVVSARFNTGTYNLWLLDGNTITVDNSPKYRCATITYQGRLSDGVAVANGQYDLRFQAFDAATGGAAQSENISIENAQVTNGIFTVNLSFGSALNENPNAKFLEIAVRPGAASGNDPFTILAPRQPITPVPYAVNAQNAESFGGKTTNQFLQISPTAAQTGSFNVSGNGKIGGNATVGNDLSVAYNAFVNGNASIGGNLVTTGTITSGCRAGFTAFAFGRLCVSELKPAATFFGASGAQQTCASLNARVGTTTDVAQTFGTSNFNYFGGNVSGWLGDYAGDNKRAVWNTNVVTADFDGDALNVYTGGTGGTAPSLAFRCVY